MSESRTRSYVGLAASTVLLLLLGGFTALIPPLFVMGSDGCVEPAERPICRGDVQQIVAFGPRVALFVGLGVAIVGGVAAAHRRRPVGPWIVASWAVPAAALLLSFTLATIGPSEEYQAQQRAEQAAEDKLWLAEERRRLIAAEAQEEAFPRYRKVVREVRAALLRKYPQLEWPDDDLFRYSIDDIYCPDDFSARSFDDRWEVYLPSEVTRKPTFDADGFALTFKRIVRAVGDQHGFDRGPESDEDYLWLSYRGQAGLGVRFTGTGDATVELNSECLATWEYQRYLRSSVRSTPFECEEGAMFGWLKGLGRRVRRAASSRESLMQRPPDGDPRLRGNQQGGSPSDEVNKRVIGDQMGGHPGASI